MEIVLRVKAFTSCKNWALPTIFPINRENLNDREGQPAYIYSRDLGSICSYTRALCNVHILLKFRVKLSAFLVDLKSYLSTGLVFVRLSLLFKFSLTDRSHFLFLCPMISLCFMPLPGC